ncbi:MAG: acetyl-CoA hydrolase/transferase C-terminal domain-containing protein [Rhodococcus fascians]
MVSYCATSHNGPLVASGLCDVLPVHYSDLPRVLTSGPLRVDVLLLQVSSPDSAGRVSVGLTDDYISSAVASARVVLVEINEHVPFTYGSTTLSPQDWTHAIHTSCPPAEMLPSPVTAELDAVATRVADLVQDGATLQFGIGALPDAVLRRLTDRADLGIHSGILSDNAMELMQAGIVTGACKTVDRGVAVAGFVTGSQRLFDFVHLNAGVSIRSTSYTHDTAVLAAQSQLVAVNSAIEVDLTGQVNAEYVGDRYVGAVGGAMDFLRGAARSPGGLPIIALPSTAKGNSRIVARLSSVVSTPRADAAIFVTEYGVADLRGATIGRRVEQMIGLAHPDFRHDLEVEFETTMMNHSKRRRIAT